MTRAKNSIRWLLPVAALLLALTLGLTPLHAAEPAPTTGETEASVSFTAGELKLVSVPVLDFGSHDIAPGEQVYPANTVSPDVQVSDLRGSGEGWDLFVSLSPFALEEGGGATLKAASINITAPTVGAVNGNLGAPPAAEADVTLASDDTETPVLRAAGGQGMGVWSLNWKAATTKLTVKAGTAEKGRSVATLTWSLQSTP